MSSDSDGAATSANNFFFGSAASSALSSTSDPARETPRLTPQATDRREDIPTKESTSDELMVRVQMRDSEAMSELFDRYCRLVFSLGFRILRSPTEAEDLVQDVFLFLWSRSHLFVPGKRSAHDWIIRVIYHRAFDRRKYLITRYSYNFGGEGHSASDTNQNSETDRISRLVSNEDNFGELLYWHSHLESAFEELSEAQQKTLKLFFYEGYTLAEISRELDEPLVNIRNHYYRGLKRLEKYVDGNGK